MITTRFQKKFREFASVLRNEYRNIFCDAGVLLIAAVSYTHLTLPTIA